MDQFVNSLPTSIYMKRLIKYNCNEVVQMAHQELNQLVKNLQNGDMSVFDEIYHATKGLVYHTILSVIKDRSLAEDLMQDTYLKALDSIHSFKPRYSFQSWLVRIAKNLAINEYNRRKRLQSFDPAETPQVFGQEESNVENQMMVEEMLSSLSDLEREIVTLHVLGDLKHREIAEIVGKPLGTVTWTYQQAIKKMKQQFGEVVES
jgi:RNA polymerase sigma-70 factor (ECF subfamily)